MTATLQKDINAHAPYQQNHILCIQDASTL